MKAKLISPLAWVSEGAHPGAVDLHGEFNFDTVSPLYAQLAPSVKLGQVKQINLSKVTTSNSAGLGLLLSLLKLAKQQGHALTFLALPQSLLAIAKVTGVAHLLPTEP